MSAARFVVVGKGWSASIAALPLADMTDVAALDSLDDENRSTLLEAGRQGGAVDASGKLVGASWIVCVEGVPAFDGAVIAYSDVTS